jgi:hypothetical protein
MEARRLLSAAIDHGVLEIQGTPRADHITLELDGRKSLRVSVNGTESAFLRKRVSKIRIVAGRGDDFVNVTRDDNFTAGVFVSGGAGDDQLLGGNGRDTIRGEDGRDLISAGEGDDLVQGGGNSDSISGEGGDDRLFGDTGDDEIDGGLGDDSLYGGRGDDTLHEEEGVDRLYGNAGHDLFHYIDSPKDVRDEDASETIVTEVPGSRFRPVQISSGGLTINDGLVGYGGGVGIIRLGGNVAGAGGSLTLPITPITTPITLPGSGGSLGLINTGGGSLTGVSTSGGGNLTISGGSVTTSGN